MPYKRPAYRPPGCAPTAFAPLAASGLLAPTLGRPVRARHRRRLHRVLRRHAVLRAPQPLLRVEPLDPGLPVGPPARSGERRDWGAERVLSLGRCPKRAARRRPGPSAPARSPRRYKSPKALAPPVNIVSPVKYALPGEGVWHVAGRTTANGIPTMYEAFVRPDSGAHELRRRRRVDGHEPVDGAAVLRFA